MTRVQLTHQEREFIGPYLPIGAYGPYPERLRQQFEGVIWRFKTGGQWRDAGVFEALLEGLIAEAAKRGEVDLFLVSVDSATARTHHDAAGMHLDEDVITALEKAAAEEGKPGQKGLLRRTKRAGRRVQSRTGGATMYPAPACPPVEDRSPRTLPGRANKQGHLAADRKCHPLAFVLTAGQAADSPQFIPVLGKIRVRGPVGRPRTRPDAVAGGQAYSSRRNRAHLRRRCIKAVIPEKRDQAANRKKKGTPKRIARPLLPYQGTY